MHLSGDKLVATTVCGGVPIIRTACTINFGAGKHGSGQLRYVTRVGGEFISGRYAFVMKTADSLRVDEVAFLDQTHSIYALRPKVPLDITFGFYSPSITFCYPGGEGPLNVPPHGI